MAPAQNMRDFGRQHAIELDSKDRLKNLRKEFIVPTKDDLKSKTLAKSCKYHSEGFRNLIILIGSFI